MLYVRKENKMDFFGLLEMIGGLALVTGAGALLVYRHRKHGKGEHASS